MKTYTVRFRQVLRTYPGVAYLFLGVPALTALAAVVFFQHPQRPDVTATGIVFCVMAALWYLSVFGVTLGFALVVTQREDGTLVLWSPLIRRRIPVDDITAIVRTSRRPRTTAYQRRVELLIVLWRGGVAGLYVAREHMEAFLAGLAERNPALQMIGFPAADAPAPVFTPPCDVCERDFAIRKTGNVFALIRHGAELAFVVLLCWQFYDGPAQQLFAVQSPRALLIEGVLCLGVLLFVAGIARSVWAALTTPLAVRLTGDGVFRMTTWFGPRRIAAKNILAIRITRRYESWWAEITYHVGARDRNLRRRIGFPTVIMPDYPAFVAAVRALNPDVVLESV